MNKTERIFKLTSLLAQEPGVSINVLKEELQISERTVYRYLSNLKSQGFPIHYEKDPQDVKLKHILRPLTFTAAEALAVKAAGQSILTHKGLPYNDALQTAIRKVCSALHCQEDKREYNQLQKRFNILDECLRDYSPWDKHIKKIQNALRHQRSIYIYYNSDSSKRAVIRKVDPYELCWLYGNLYFIAYCHNRKKVLTFRVNRIQSSKNSNNTFKRLKNFNLNDYLKDTWRIYRSDEKIKVKILVYPPVSRFFEEAKYHESQQVEKVGDNKIICKYEVDDSPEFRNFLLGWGKGVKVLEPEKLREEIIQEIKEMYILYRDNNY